MKVSPDRLPPQEKVSSINTAMPYAQTGPLHARKRARSPLADDTTKQINSYGEDSHFYEGRPENGISSEGHGLDIEAPGSFAAPGQSVYQNSYYDESEEDVIYNSPNQPNQATSNYYPDGSSPANTAARARSSDRTRYTQNSQGPYQAVVVFLLLLMVLVIMSIVYQLFFRPNSEQPLVAETEAPISSVSEIQNSEEETDTVSDRSYEQLPKTNTEPLNNSSVVSSPVSNITPGGEEIEPAASDLEYRQQSIDENELLLKSKVGGIGYWIQVGAFSSLSNANRMKDQIAKKHLESVIQESKNNTGIVYRVRIGLYASREEALRILRQLKNTDKEFINSIVIQIEI